MSNKGTAVLPLEIESCLAVVDALIWRPDDCQSTIDDYWRDRVALPALLADAWPAQPLPAARPATADKIFLVLVRRVGYAIAGRQVPTWRIMYAIAKHPTMWPAVAAALLATLKNVAQAILRDALAGRVDLDKQLSWEDEGGPATAPGEARTVPAGETVSRPIRQSEMVAAADDEAGREAAMGRGGLPDEAAGQVRALKEVCDGFTTASTPEELLDYMRILGSDLLAHPAVLRNLDACLELALAGVAFTMSTGGGDGSACTLGVRSNPLLADSHTQVSRAETLPAWKVLRALAVRPDLAPQLRAGYVEHVRKILAEHAVRLEKDQAEWRRSLIRLEDEARE